MQQQQSLRVVDGESESVVETGVESPTEVPEPDVHSAYDDADAVALGDYEASYSFPKFVESVMGKIGKDFGRDDARVVDAMPDTTDIEFGVLLAWPDESLLFVGKDPTAKDAIPWFAFSIEPMEPVPTPETAQDALDMLKPPDVRDIAHTEEWLPDRHGEWWLVPTQMVPAGTVFEPGVQSKPYGPSPLGNHVPREYAFTVTDSTFMDGFHYTVDAPGRLQTPSEVLEWSWRQQQKSPVPDYAPDWNDVRNIAGDVLVRGTVRHRNNDHYVENLRNDWHRALTHDVEVYTGDEIATDIHLDYHGG